MSIAGHTHRHYLPDASQHTLLTALLAPPTAAAAAARQWLDTVDFDAIAEGEMRLMPMLHDRLRALGIDHPLAGRIRGLYRRAWYVDQTMRRDLAALIATVARVSPDVVLLKGAALGLYAYADPAHRPFADFDILVPDADQERVIAALVAEQATPRFYAFHAFTVRLTNGREVDVHRSPYHEAFGAALVAPLFGRLRRLAGPASAPSPAPAAWSTLGDADQLLHTLVHGLKPNPIAPIRWLVDAVLLVRAAGETFDWDTLVAEAGRLDFVEPAIVGLREIARFEPSPALSQALETLGRHTTPQALAAWSAASVTPVDGPVRIWERTRRNARGFARLTLMARFYRRKDWRGESLPSIARRTAILAIRIAATAMRRRRRA